MENKQSNKTGKLDQIRQVIKTRLDEGETAQMIYKDLASTFGNDAKYERVFSRLVGSTPSEATRQTNKILHQSVVIGFIILMIMFFMKRHSTIENFIDIIIKI